MASVGRASRRSPSPRICKLAVVAERGKVQADPGGGRPGRLRCVWSSEAGSGG